MSSKKEGNNKNLNSKETSSMKEEFSLSDFLSDNEIHLEDFQIEKFLKGENEGLKGRNFFDEERSGYTEALLAKAKEKKLIEEYDFSLTVPDLTQRKLIELANLALPIEVNSQENVLYLVQDDGSKTRIEIEETGEDLKQRKALADVFPPIQFDLAQSGILEQAKEAEAIYKIFCINSIFGGLYSNRIKKVLSNYDLKVLSKNSRNFTVLLKEITEDAPKITAEIISLCNFKISELKVKKSMKLYTSLSSQVDSGLRELKISIAQLRLEKEPIINSEETKARREVAREKLRAEEEELVNKSPVGAYYHILNMNSEHINPIAYAQITELADDLAEQIKEREELSDYPSLFRSIKRKLKQRCFREYLSEYKNKAIAELEGRIAAKGESEGRGGTAPLQ